VPEISAKAREWIEDCRATGGFSPRTLEGYVNCLSLLVRYGVTRVEGITRDNVTKWLYERRRKDRVMATTCNRNLAAVLSFVSWLERRGEFPLDEYQRIKRCRTRQEPKPPPQFLTREQFAKLIAVAPSVAPAYELALDLAVHTGLRVSELLQVLHEDFVFDDEEPFLRVARTWGRENKRRQERSVPLGKLDGTFVKRLKGYGIGPPHVGPVLPAQQLRAGGIYLHKNTLEDWMKVGRAAAGLPPSTTFLLLRHTFASWVLRARIYRDVAVLAKIMGNSVATCMAHYAGWFGGDASIEALHAPMKDRPVVLRTKGVSLAEKTTPELFRILDPLPTPAAKAIASEDLERLRAAERAMQRARDRGRLS
jgi:integrase